jgi:hypothetical protein
MVQVCVDAQDKEIEIAASFKEQDLVMMALNFTSLPSVLTAESIFKYLRTAAYKDQSMGILARKLAFHFEKKNDELKAKAYTKYAEELLLGEI